MNGDDQLNTDDLIRKRQLASDLLTRYTSQDPNMPTPAPQQAPIQLPYQNVQAPSTVGVQGAAQPLLKGPPDKFDPKYKPSLGKEILWGFLTRREMTQDPEKWMQNVQDMARPASYRKAMQEFEQNRAQYTIQRDLLKDELERSRSELGINNDFVALTLKLAESGQMPLKTLQLNSEIAKNAAIIKHEQATTQKELADTNAIDKPMLVATKDGKITTAYPRYYGGDRAGQWDAIGPGDKLIPRDQIVSQEPLEKGNALDQAFQLQRTKFAAEGKAPPDLRDMMALGRQWNDNMKDAQWQFMKDMFDKREAAAEAKLSEVRGGAEVDKIIDSNRKEFEEDNKYVQSELQGISKLQKMLDRGDTTLNGFANELEVVLAETTAVGGGRSVPRFNLPVVRSLINQTSWYERAYAKARGMILPGAGDIPDVTRNQIRDIFDGIKEELVRQQNVMDKYRRENDGIVALTPGARDKASNITTNYHKEFLGTKPSESKPSPMPSQDDLRKKFDQLPDK